MTKSTIVTFHYALNYGASLQVYALQKTLSSLIGPVQVLHYVPGFLAAPHRCFSRSLLRAPFCLLANLVRKRAQISRFRRFLAENINLSGQMVTKAEDVRDHESDLFFLGSDQIWNPDITGGFDRVYFGGFHRKETSRVVSYAASVERPSFDEMEKRDLARLLQNVERISVREQSAKRLIGTVTGKPIEVVLDPTLLLSADEWRLAAKHPEQRDYVLLYSMGGETVTLDIAKEKAKQLGVKLVEVLPSHRFIRGVQTHTRIATAGPAEFLGLFENASFVVTDSFHGTAFALVYNKQFITVPHKARGGRMTDLLTRLGLEDRLVRTAGTAPAAGIDFVKVNALLCAERARSIAFLSAIRG